MNARQHVSDADRAAAIVRVGFGQRLSGWMRAHAWFMRPFLSVLAAAAALAACWWLFTITDPESFWRSVVDGLLGAAITIAGAALVAVFALRNQLRAFRERRAIRRFTDRSWESSSIRVGRMQIPDISIVASASLRTAVTDRTRIEFARFAQPRPVHPVAAKARAETLPLLQERAAEGNAQLFDGDCVDIVDARLDISRDSSGRRTTTYTLVPAPARYFDFATTTARLDEPTPTAVDPQQRSLREIWGKGPASLLEVSQLPAMAKLGGGTVAVTRDDRLVLGVRGRTFIAGGTGDEHPRRAVHIVAEGPTPDDVDASGVMDPLVTARRGLVEELGVGLQSGHVGTVRDLIPVGVFFDQQRWQPCFATLAHLDLDWSELQTAASAAQDGWEVEGLVTLPFDIGHQGLRRLMLGTHPDLRFASNHAAACVWFALVWKHGYHALRDHLLI